jgi:hypothetical protein
LLNVGVLPANLLSSFLIILFFSFAIVVILCYFFSPIFVGTILEWVRFFLECSVWFSFSVVLKDGGGVFLFKRHGRAIFMFFRLHIIVLQVEDSFLEFISKNAFNSSRYLKSENDSVLLHLVKLLCPSNLTEISALDKLLSTINFRWFGPLNGSK